MSYTRVIPRDFFNEAKLLNCLGKLHLFLMDQHASTGWSVDFDDEPFEIVMDPGTGNLSVLNYRVFFKDEPLDLYTPYNSREKWPLYGVFRGEEYVILDQKGKPLDNLRFINACNNASD